jgi:hypothetical protein
MMARQTLTPHLAHPESASAHMSFSVQVRQEEMQVGMPSRDLLIAHRHVFVTVLNKAYHI